MKDNQIIEAFRNIEAIYKQEFPEKGYDDIVGCLYAFSDESVTIDRIHELCPPYYTNG